MEITTIKIRQAHAHIRTYTQRTLLKYLILIEYNTQKNNEQKNYLEPLYSRIFEAVAAVGHSLRKCLQIYIMGACDN